MVCPAAHILPIHFERRFFSFLLPTDVLHLLDTSLLVSSLVVSRLVVSVSSWLLLLFLDTSWVLLSGCWLYFLRRNRSKDSLDIRVLLLFFLPLRCTLRGLIFFPLLDLNRFWLLLGFLQRLQGISNTPGRLARRHRLAHRHRLADRHRHAHSFRRADRHRHAHRFRHADRHKRG